MRAYDPLRRRRLSMTSLIDVIFLLLLFFMLSSTFARFGEIDLTTGGTGGTADKAQMVFLRLAESGLSVNGTVTQPADLAPLIEALRTDAPLHLLLSVTGGTQAQALADTLHQVSGLPGTRITVVN